MSINASNLGDSTDIYKVEDLVNSSKDFYDHGLVFDQGFYKKAIPQTSFQEPVSSKSRSYALAFESLLDISKRAATIGIIVIPAAALIGTGAFVPLLVSGVVGALISDAQTPEEGRPPHIFEQIGMKANLLAAMGSKDKAYYLFREFMISTAAKVVVAAIIIFDVYSFGSATASTAVFFYGYSLGSEILDLTKFGIEEYFRRYALPVLEAQVPV